MRLKRFLPITVFVCSAALVQGYALTHARSDANAQIPTKQKNKSRFLKK